MRGSHSYRQYHSLIAIGSFWYVLFHFGLVWFVLFFSRKWTGMSSFFLGFFFFFSLSSSSSVFEEYCNKRGCMKSFGTDCASRRCRRCRRRQGLLCRDIRLDHLCHPLSRMQALHYFNLHAARYVQGFTHQFWPNPELPQTTALPSHTVFP